MKAPTSYRSGLILSYARSENCLRLVEELIEYNCQSLFIYLDAPKDSEIEDSQKNLIIALREISLRTSKSLKIRRANSNQGIAISMIRALDWFFENCDEGFILEDDLVVSPSFLPFMFLNLEKFRKDNSVLMISGNRYSTEELSTSAVWCNYPQTWGWATWRSRWQVIRKIYASGITILDFNIHSAVNNFWAMGTNYVSKQILDTWDLPIAYLMQRKKYWTLLPPLNLVSNVGNDSAATHTIRDSFPLNFPIYELDIDSLESIATIEYRLTSSKYENSFLEKRVFNIKWFHVFLFFKYLIYKNNNNFIWKELQKEPKFQDFRFV